MSDVPVHVGYRALFPPGLDPPGFDRSAYQAQLSRELVAFLRAH